MNFENFAQKRKRVNQALELSLSKIYRLDNARHQTNHPDVNADLIDFGKSTNSEPIEIRNTNNNDLQKEDDVCA